MSALEPDEPLPELRALYQSLRPAEPADELAETAPETERVVRWAQGAWRALPVPAAVLPRRLMRTEVERTKLLLARLDVPRATEASSWKTIEYRPRFLSLQTTARAAASVVDSADPLEERGLVMLSGEGEAVDGALALLARIDVPERQVLLTCLMIEVGSSMQGPELPPDLAANLQKLLPQSRFTQTGMAMLKTAVTGSAKISLEVETLDGYGYRLSFDPVSFDESSASLTIANCTLVENNQRQLFQTNTVLRGGEYTVLAATGSAPKLLVVRVVPQG